MVAALGRGIPAAVLGRVTRQRAVANGADSVEDDDGLSRIGSGFCRVHFFENATATNAATALLKPVAVVHGITDAIHFAVLVGARTDRHDPDGLGRLGRVGRSSNSDNRSGNEDKELHGEWGVDEMLEAN